MVVGLNNYIENLINVRDPLNMKNLRWVFHNKKISYIEKSKILPSSIKKIEYVLFRLNEDFKKFDAYNVDKNAYNKLKNLIQLVEEKVKKYKSKHGKIYLFFSRLFFGDVDKRSKAFTNHLDSLRRRYENNLIDNRGNNIDANPNIINDNANPMDNGFGKVNPKPINPKLRKNHPTKARNVKKDLVEKAKLIPLVYKAYVPSPTDESKKLENQVKEGRLKFYEIFSEKIQTPEPNDELFLPLMDINHRGVEIYLPQQLIHDGFDVWLKQKCEGFKVVFKEEELTHTIKLKDKKGYISERNIGVPFSDIRCFKKFTLSLEEANKLINEVPDQGLAHLSKFIKQPDLKVHHCFESHKHGNEPQIEDTISLTLAQLDPKLHQLIKDVKSHPELQAQFPVPLVEFDDQGISIKIPDLNKDAVEELTEEEKTLISSCENLKNLLKQVLGLKGSIIEETHIDRNYGYMFQINPDDIENFLKQLGMDKIPPEGLFEKRYAKGDITYIQHLVQTERYHAYQPVKTNDALESIQDSLAKIVPYNFQVKPYVSYHPRGWLSLKFQDWSDDYVQKLAAFLKTEPLCINQAFNKENYTSEIIIDEKELPAFLQKLKLDTTPDGTSYQDRLLEFRGAALEALNENDFRYAEDENGQLDLRRTIMRVFSALEPNVKEILRGFSAKDLPETSIDLVQIDYTQGVKIPQQLNDTMIYIGPERVLSFGEYLSHIFGIEGTLKKEMKNGKEENLYVLKVPQDRFENLLKKDLALRYLPPKYRKKDIATFYNQLKFDLSKNMPHQKLNNFDYAHNLLLDFFNGNFQQGNFNYQIPAYAPHASVADLRLRNPSARFPDVIPEMSDEDILKNVAIILDKSKSKDTYVAAFANTFKRITPGKDNPDIKEYNSHIASAGYIRDYLKVIMHKLMTDADITEDHKREPLIEIALGCKGDTCLPGRLSKIQKVYQKLMRPELDDIVKCTLLFHVQEFKSDLLASFELKIDGKISRLSDSKLEHGEHIGNAAKILWGDEFGLNKEEALRDENAQGEIVQNLQLVYLSAENKQRFKTACEKNLLRGVFEYVKNDLDEEGAVQYIAEYRDRLCIILREEGLKPAEVNEEIERLLPDEVVKTKDGQKELKTVTEEAIKLLLIDIGVLNP